MKAPIVFTWTGSAMEPLRRFHNRCSTMFDLGKRYALVETEERSRRSHQHYFAAVHEAWQNLPEHLSGRFPTSEHLRKWALIKCNYVNITQIATANNGEALKVEKLMQKSDPYAAVDISDNVVTIGTPQSQKVKRGENGGMDAKTFQKSKQDVLDFLQEMIGVEAGDLEANAGQAA